MVKPYNQILINIGYSISRILFHSDGFMSWVPLTEATCLVTIFSLPQWLHFLLGYVITLWWNMFLLFRELVVTTLIYLSSIDPWIKTHSIFLYTIILYWFLKVAICELPFDPIGSEVSGGVGGTWVHIISLITFSVAD